MEYTVEILLGLTVILLVFYYRTKSALSYWKKRGVPGPRPLPLFGNFTSVFFKRKAPFEVITDIYRDYRKYPFAGAYRNHKPMLVINDLNLVKNVLIKDFSTFAGRGLNINEEKEPLTANLFNIDGPRWKHLRIKLTPIFTSGKLKHMFDLILECADYFEKYLEQEVGNGKVIDVKETTARYTTDVIGSCAFGISMNALADEDSEFRRIGREMFESNFIKLIKRLLKDTAPGLFKLLGLRSSSKATEKFIISMIRDTMALRQREGMVRHDLIDTLISMKKNNDTNEWKLTDENLAAQALVFFAAGFETSSTTMSFALLELSHAPELQIKLRNEILEVLEQHNGKITYEATNEMKYLDMVVQETLRKDPPATSLIRHAFQSYKIPESDVTIEAGTDVFIPTYAIQHDPEYFPHPEVFDPERFSDENKRLRHPMAHLPFGDGPKNCIGERFALYQTKLGLIKFLKNYRVEPTERSPLPYEIDKGALILSPKGGIFLKFVPIA